jgi:hypothetical protein
MMQTGERELFDLSDLDEAMIRHVAQAFIALHGMRRMSDGKLISSGSSESVATTIYELLDNPLRGLRQVVPMISMLTTNLGLAFNDELYELELKKLADRQRLADEIEQVLSSSQDAVLRINVADLLAQLESHEFIEAIPLIEARLEKEAHVGVVATREEVIARIRRLWRDYSDSEIVLNLRFDGDTQQTQAQAQHIVTSTMPASTDANAQQWLAHRGESETENFDDFIRAFTRETPEMQVAIEKRLTTDAGTVKLSKMAVDLKRNEQVESAFFEWLKRILGWWVYRR